MIKDWKETTAWQCWTRYRDGFLARSGVVEVLKEARNFYRGKQYEDTADKSLPKPCLNICREYAEKVTAKVVGTPHSIHFVSDSTMADMTKMNEFYEYQMGKIDDEAFTARVCLTGFIDGAAVVFTSYDEDTLGIRGTYRGFIKRQLIPFERCFFDNPYCEDEQEQRYLGYTASMEIGAVKRLLEGSDKEKAEKSKRLVPDDFVQADGSIVEPQEDVDGKKCTVVTRLFRNKDGEVFFELSTRFVDVYETPHALNPNINYEIDMKLKDVDSQSKDYVDGTQKYTLYTKLDKETKEHYEKEKKKFTRYPVSIFRPYPITGTVLGESGVSKMIDNQKVINYTYLLDTLIMQFHAMPKYLVKSGAMKGQVIDNSPYQILTDYTPYSNGNWGITRLNPGDAVNNSLIEFTSVFINATKQTNGFDNLTSDSLNSDMSGFAMQQYIKQTNLTLEIPQKRLWLYLKSNARIDLLMFKFHVKNADFFITRDDGYVDLNENYRGMSQRLQAQQEGQPQVELPEVKKNQIEQIGETDFDREWDVSVEVQQGIAGSDISESQHYNQIYQYMANGLDAELLRAMISADPAISYKVKNNLRNELEAMKTSQLEQMKAENQQLKQYVDQLASYLKNTQAQVQEMGARLQSYRKATEDNAKLNQAVVSSMQSQETEGEVKSQNAKGVGGNSFDDYGF